MKDDFVDFLLLLLLLHYWDKAGLFPTSAQKRELIEKVRTHYDETKTATVAVLEEEIRQALENPGE